jgi:hypothetical protein
MRRRDLLVAGMPWFSPASAATGPVRLAAAWDSAQGSRVGVIESTAGAWRVAADVEVPTRAHGVIIEPEGTLLAVARRPGDWMLRWRPGGRPLWAWNDSTRYFNGHVRRRGDRLCTTETDVETGHGKVVVRDARSLQVQAVWSSEGTDPHDMLFAQDGTLWVANGGIETRPETGRAKRNLQQMDSSLVRLGSAGSLLGHWRLDDRRLSLRHLTRVDGRVGIALQAEHDDPAQRAQAPVLALFDGKQLKAMASPPLAGYGGDIAATAAGFAVSVPRAGGIALFDKRGQWLERLALDEACALAVGGAALYAGGRPSAMTVRDGIVARITVPSLKLDNHWQADAGGT